MKMIIDIPEMYLDFCKACSENNIDTVDQRIIANGTPYEERPHGKWIDRNGNTWCSECRNDTIYIEGDRPLRTDFCPNCGADMREGRQ